MTTIPPSLATCEPAPGLGGAGSLGGNNDGAPGAPGSATF